MPGQLRAQTVDLRGRGGFLGSVCGRPAEQALPQAFPGRVGSRCRGRGFLPSQVEGLGEQFGEGLDQGIRSRIGCQTLEFLAQLLDAAAGALGQGQAFEQLQQGMGRGRGTCLTAARLIELHQRAGHGLDALGEALAVLAITDGVAQSLQLAVQGIIHALGGQGQARQGAAQQIFYFSPVLFLFFNGFQAVVVLAPPQLGILRVVIRSDHGILLNAGTDKHVCA